MKAIIVIDAQNEFSSAGKRSIPDFERSVDEIRTIVQQARLKKIPIAWIRHHNKPDESPAFVPESWGAEFVDGMGPAHSSEIEVEFQKNVYGAFTGSSVGSWLDDSGISEILIAGFYTHGCVSTTAREAIMRGLTVYLDPLATASCDIRHEQLGVLTAAESRNAALLHLSNMGCIVGSFQHLIANQHTV